MYRFNNDYNRGACPEILEALGRENGLGFDGYGEDTWCRRGADTIRELVGRADAAVHFLPGATQANFVVIAAALNSVQSVIAADTGHITCHEAASVEHTGRKIEHLPNREGKISAEQIAERALTALLVLAAGGGAGDRLLNRREKLGPFVTGEVECAAADKGVNRF